MVNQIFGAPRTPAARMAAFSFSDEANALAFRVVAKSCQTVTSFRSSVDRKTAWPRTPIAGRFFVKGVVGLAPLDVVAHFVSDKQSDHVTPLHVAARVEHRNHMPPTEYG